MVEAKSLLYNIYNTKRKHYYLLVSAQNKNTKLTTFYKKKKNMNSHITSLVINGPTHVLNDYIP